MANDKASAAYHPGNAHLGFNVTCVQCDDPNVFHSMWYDVAERFADTHAATRGHDTDIVRVQDDG
jgi:hypothetical protein